MLFPEGAYILFSIQIGANLALLLPWISRMLINKRFKKFEMYFWDPFWGSAEFSTFWIEYKKHICQREFNTMIAT
jgi:hypothetical protein